LPCAGSILTKPIASSDRQAAPLLTSVGGRKQNACFVEIELKQVALGERAHRRRRPELLDQIRCVGHVDADGIGGNHPAIDVERRTSVESEDDRKGAPCLSDQLLLTKPRFQVTSGLTITTTVMPLL
jgi:hypothetical protein